MENTGKRNVRYQKCAICKLKRIPGANVFMSKFPLDPDRCRSWVKAVGKEDFAYIPITKLHEIKYLCGSHFEKKYFNTKGNRLLKNAVPTLNLPQPLDDSLLEDFPLQSEETEKSQVLKVFQDITNSENVPWKENILSKSAEYSFVPLPSTSQAPQGLTFEKALVSQNETVENVKVAVRNYERIVGKPNRNRDSTLTKREKILLSRLTQIKLSLKRLANTSIDLDKLDSDTLRLIVSDGKNNQNRNFFSIRWCLKNKILALSIYKRSPKAYRYLQKLLPMPSIRTLQRLLKHVPIDTGIHKNIISLMKNKATNMNELDKYCCVIFDEIALKKRLIYNEVSDQVDGFVDYGSGEGMGRRNRVADHALVFMALGVRKKYKQPIAHYFVEGSVPKEKLAVIIKQVVEALSESGFKVLATICDQGPTNMGALNLLKNISGQPTDDNFFYCNNSKIYIIYDIPHLFKSIRNNFYNGGIMKLGNYTAKWQHLIEAEKKNRNFLNFPKLTDNVVNPTHRVKMRVKYAAYALSNTTAAILKMWACIEQDPFKDELMQTANVIQELDRLFDCTNGPASFKDVKKGFRENVSSKSNHIEKWNYYLKLMDSIVFLNRDTLRPMTHVRCVKGFKITLQSFKDIWNFLHNEVGFKYLNLRQLNQDSLENLFGLLRQHSVTNKNLSCSSFTDALKAGVISGLVAPHSRNANCEEDPNKLFVAYKDISEVPTDMPKGNNNDDIQVVDEIAYPVLSLPNETDFFSYENDLCNFEEQPVVYVSGYLAAKLLDKTSCEKCKDSLKVDKPVDDLYNYIHFKEWWKDSSSLCYPSKPLCHFVNKSQIHFKSIISQDLHIKNIKQWTSLQLSNESLEWFICQEHFIEKTNQLIHNLCLLFIRKLCKDKNMQLEKCDRDKA